MSKIALSSISFQCKSLNSSSVTRVATIIGRSLGRAWPVTGNAVRSRTSRSSCQAGREADVPLLASALSQTLINLLFITSAPGQNQASGRPMTCDRDGDAGAIRSGASGLQQPHKRKILPRGKTPVEPAKLVSDSAYYLHNLLLILLIQMAAPLQIEIHNVPL